MDFITVGKEEIAITNYSKNESSDDLQFTAELEGIDSLVEVLNKSSELTVNRYSENDGRKGMLYISETHYGYKPQNIIANYASNTVNVTLARPTITIKGVADVDRVMGILDEAGYKIEEKEQTK